MQNYISINITYIRSRSGLSQEDIGNIIGTSYHAVSSYEKKKSLPPIDKIQLFCKEFNLSIDDFVTKDLSKAKVDSSYKTKEDLALSESNENKKFSENENNLYNRLIEAKDAQIESLELRILELKKQTSIYEVLLNQNGVL